MWILRAAEESMVVVRGPHIFGLQEDEKEFSKGKYTASRVPSALSTSNS